MNQNTFNNLHRPNKIICLENLKHQLDKLGFKEKSYDLSNEHNNFLNELFGEYAKRLNEFQSKKG